jgi:NAD(P)-dependent dehydrogenase (short-subunit alcohol dehydrogenase family)
MRSPQGSDLTAGFPDRIKVFQLDVTDEATIKAAVVGAVAAFGRIDVLVNNAGYGLLGLFEEMSEAQVRRQIETNLIGLMSVTRAVLPVMRSQRSGRIINVSSVAGRLTLPLYTTYCASKYGVEGFSEALGYEVRQHGIQVKIIEPGAIKSEFFGRSFDSPEGARLKDYGHWGQRVFASIKDKCADPPGPQLVARSIYKAATAWPGWRMRYKPNGFFLILGRILLPAEIHTRVVRFLLGAW